MAETYEWALMRGEVVLGYLSQSDLDMPWISCKFARTAEFSEYEKLFAAELALLNDDRMDEWEEAYQTIGDLGLTLRSTSGEVIGEMILHVEGEESWFRY